MNKNQPTRWQVPIDKRREQLAETYAERKRARALAVLSEVADPDTSQVLTNKTLQAPKLTGLGNYTNDANAAAGGVPVGGVYRDGSVLMVRVT